LEKENVRENPNKIAIFKTNNKWFFIELPEIPLVLHKEKKREKGC